LAITHNLRNNSRYGILSSNYRTVWRGVMHFCLSSMTFLNNILGIVRLRTKGNRVCFVCTGTPARKKKLCPKQDEIRVNHACQTSLIFSPAKAPAKKT
jgi:hypothetical protein